MSCKSHGFDIVLYIFFRGKIIFIVNFHKKKSETFILVKKICETNDVSHTHVPIQRVKVKSYVFIFNNTFRLLR